MENKANELNEYLKDLEILVNIDSGSKDISGVEKVNHFLINKFLEIGWIVKTHNFNNSVASCIEIKNNDKEDIDILILGHSDTVFPNNTVKNRPFSIKDSKAYGPGVIDMKSGLLSVYYAIKDLDKESLPNICFAINSHEEISSSYSFPWIQELSKKSKIALVCEPARANGFLVNKRKGLARYDIEFKGIAAHTGVNPEAGASAISEAGHWIVELHKLTNLKLGTILNIGIINGGTASNVVAENVVASLDVRFIDQLNLEKIEETLQNWIDKPFIKNVVTKVERKGWRPPMNPSEKTMELCDLISTIGKNLKIDINYAETGGGSDANFTSALGVPTVDGMGPIGGGAHSVNEYLEIQSIIPRINLLKEIIKNFKKIY